MAADETELVTVTVLRVERVNAGRLLALASTEILIAGVAFTLHGVRVIRTGPRSRGIAAPADAIELPPELAEAVANAVLDVYDELGATYREPPAPVAPKNRPAPARQEWPKRHPPLP